MIHYPSRTGIQHPVPGQCLVIGLACLLINLVLQTYVMTYLYFHLAYFFAHYSANRIGVVNLLCDHSVSIEDTSLIMIGELSEYHYVSFVGEILTLHLFIYC